MRKIFLLVILLLGAFYLNKIYRGNGDAPIEVRLATNTSVIARSREAAAPKPYPVEAQTSLDSPLKQAKDDIAIKQSAAAPIQEWDSSIVWSMQPSLENYRADVATNPHSLPASLKEHSQRISALLDSVNKKQVASAKAFEDLRRCSENEVGIKSSRALCLIGARAIAKADRTLMPQYQGLFEKTPIEVQQLTVGLNF